MRQIVMKTSVVSVKKCCARSDDLRMAVVSPLSSEGLLSDMIPSNGFNNIAARTPPIALIYSDTLTESISYSLFMCCRKI